MIADARGDAGTSPVVTGRGTYVPDDVLTNADVAGIADPARLDAFTLSNAWCRQRTAELRADGERDAEPQRLARRVFAEFVERRVGIRERRVIDREAILARRPGRRGVFAGDLGARAAVRALAQAGLTGADVDAVVCGTSTPDSLCPSTAVEIQHAIGAHGAFAFDVMAACSSFGFALTTARALAASGAARRVLVVSAEYFSAMVDWSDPATAYFAGDGAAAVVLESAEAAGARPGMRVRDALCASRYSDSIRTGVGGTRVFLAGLAGDRDRAGSPGDDAYRFFHQNGPQVYRDVLPLVDGAVRRLLARHGATPERVARWWVHQASLPMLDGLFGRLTGGRPPSDVLPVALERLGNTSSCGAAWCLAEDRGLAPGELGVLVTFGGGYTVGTVLFEGA